MNARERILAALRRERTGPPPIGALLTSINRTMMERTGEDYATAATTPERYARLAAAPWEVYGLEGAKIPFDMTVEPEIFGAEIEFGGPLRLPQVRRHAFGRPEHFILPAGWQDRGRVPFMRQVLRLLKERYGDGLPITHLCDGPFTLTNMIFGFDNVLGWLMEEPEAYRRAMESVTDFCIEYCLMLEESGADIVLFGEAAASGDMISGRQYTEHIAPYHARLAREVRLPTVMHICGNITGHLSALADTGLDALSFDQKTDPAEAVRVCREKMALVGYVPIPVLNEGTPEQVAASARECVAAGMDIVHAGCAWPPSVPDANAKAFVSVGNETCHKDTKTRRTE